MTVDHLWVPGGNISPLQASPILGKQRSPVDDILILAVGNHEGGFVIRLVLQAEVAMDLRGIAG